MAESVKRSQSTPRFSAACSRGLIHQDAPHRFGRCGKEMPPGVPMLVRRVPHQSQIRLVHQRCGLQRLPWLLLGHLRRGQLAQFFVDERQELSGSSRIAGFNLTQDAGDVAHGRARRSNRPWVIVSRVMVDNSIGSPTEIVMG